MSESDKSDKSRVLVVDDEAAVRFATSEVLSEHGHLVSVAASVAEALAILDTTAIDAVVSDLVMPGADGLALLAEVRRRDPELPFVLLTARGSERVAVQAMKAGAWDYLPKPYDVDELALTVARALAQRRLAGDARRAVAERATGRPFVAESAVMRALMTRVERLARRDVSVLVRGDTGTGKELVGAMLHALSPRASGPLVRFNAAALPAELAEAELFGHARGAFTGAREARPGFFAQADGGTLVIDEIGELTNSLQPKLLRALQDGEIQPVGAGRVTRVDARVVACTNRDLASEAAAGRFRADLYYRLAVVEVVVPPLGERRADIAPLARAFAARAADRFGLEDVRLSDRLIAELVARDWPGNVRELENTVTRLVADSDGGLLDALAPASSAVPTALASPASPDAASMATSAPLRQQLDALERRLVSEAMTAAAGNRAEAARRLGMSRVTLLDRMKRLGLD